MSTINETVEKTDRESWMSLDMMMGLLLGFVMGLTIGAFLMHLLVT